MVASKTARRTVGGTSGVMRFPDVLQRVTRFDETGTDGFHRSWIMLFPVGHYEHEQYGELDFTPEKLRRIKQQYDQRVRHIDAALDVDHRAAHDDSRATGWIESLELRDAAPDGSAPAGLWGCIKWTPYGMQFLSSDEYRYFSPEFGPWEDPQSHEKWDDVLIGGALTNRPFLKTMPAIALAERDAEHRSKDVTTQGGQAATQAISRRPWGSVDKTQLPAACFLIVGDPAKKSTWRLPVYEGAGALGADGMYARRGPLNLNAVKAAYADVNGAQSGKPMQGVSASVKARLARWRARYFPDAVKRDASGKDSRKAREQSGQRGSEWWQLAVETGDSAAGGGVMEGRVGRKYASDLDDDDLFEADDEGDDEDTDALALADKPAKGSAAMKAKMTALRKKSSLKLGKGKKSGAADDSASDDDGDEMAEPEEDDSAAMAEDTADDEVYDDSEELDEADGDGPDTELADPADAEEDDADVDVDPEDDDGPEDEDESDDMPPKSARRGGGGKAAAKSKRMMGARTAVRGGAHVRASEGSMERSNGGETISLAEAKQLREEVAQLRFRLYEEGIEKTLAGWSKGSFQFKENAKGAPKTGHIALSKSFREAFRAYMRSEGVRLSEGQRAKLLGLVEVALSSAVVDLSERGSSYDPEGRMVGASRRRAAGDDDKLQQVAERIALSEHNKPITALSEAQMFAVYQRASEEVRY